MGASYKRATVMQASLAVVAAVAGGGAGSRPTIGSG